MRARNSSPQHVGTRIGAASWPPLFFCRTRAFTLLELLVVVCILAIVAGGVVLSVEGEEAGAQLAVAQKEMTDLHAAVLRFRRDTGHWPKRGPFALVVDGGRLDPSVDADWPADAPAAPADRIAWFRSPANLYQLFESATAPSFQSSLDVVAGPGEVFNHDSGRGYAGPYLSRHGEGYVLIGDDLGVNGAGDPAAGDARQVPGVADPFVAPVPAGGLFAWASVPLAPGAAALGRPYLLFTAPPGSLELGPRILGFGPDGVYDSSATAIGGDDLVVFLEE